MDTSPVNEISFTWLYGTEKETKYMVTGIFKDLSCKWKYIGTISRRNFGAKIYSLIPIILMYAPSLINILEL